MSNLSELQIRSLMLVLNWMHLEFRCMHIIEAKLPRMLRNRFWACWKILEVDEILVDDGD